MKNLFPIFSQKKNLVYLDNAATTQKPKRVMDRITKFYSEQNANVHRGIYELSELATKEYDNARSCIGGFINAPSESEIIFTGGTTDSINLVSYSWIWKNVFEGDTILTTQMEHHANFVPWQQACKYKKNTKLEIVKVKSDYTLDLEDLKAKLRLFQPKLLALTHVSNVLGTINPIKEIVEIKNRLSPQTRVLVDGAQAVGHIPVDVQDLGCDFYAFSGHKIYGPMGIGVLWAKKEILENEMSPFRYGGGMIADVEELDSTWAQLPEKFEGGTPNVEGAVALAEACMFIKETGWNKVRKHENNLISYALEQLAQIKQLKVYGPSNPENRVGVVTFGVDGVHPHDVAEILSESNVAVRAGHHCAQILTKQVLKVSATTRACFGIYNTTKDVDRLVIGLKQVVKLFK